MGSGISATSNGSTNSTLSTPELTLLDTPCKPRKHSWSGACSSESFLTASGLTSYALLPHTLPAKTESKSQLTGLVVLAIWFQRWKCEQNRHHIHDDVCVLSLYNYLLESSVRGDGLCIDIFRIYFRSPLLEL